MKVKYVKVPLPRRDGVRGEPTAVTEGKEYEVVELLLEQNQYTILNDDFKLAHYDMRRFEIIDFARPEPLRENFNRLTTPMRSRIKELEKQIEEMQKPKRCGNCGW